MADFSALEATIAANIKQNGTGAITGPILQAQLLAIVDEINDEKADNLTYSSFYGAVLDSGAEVTVTENTFFLVGAGTYTVNDTAVTFSTPGIHFIVADIEGGVVESGTITTFDTTPTSGSTNPVTSGTMYNVIRALEDADTTLQDNIDDEAAAREDADTTLQDNIDAEADARAAADALLQDKDTDAVEGNLAVFDDSGNSVDSGVALGDVALKDGYYEGMTVGLAENLVDTKGTGTEQEFTFRTSCGDQSISDDGSAVMQEIRGNSLAWNQLIRDFSYWSAMNGTISISDDVLTYTVTTAVGASSQYAGDKRNIDIVAGHKYLSTADVKLEHAGIVYFGGLGWGTATSQSVDTADTWTTFSRIATATESGTGTNAYISLSSYSDDTEIAVGDTMQIRNVKVIDLTLLFGSGNEPSSVDEFTALFPEPYYPYNAGTIINNTTESIVTTGYNLYDPDTGTAELVLEETYGYQITGTYTALSFTGVSGDTSTISPDSDGYFSITENGTLSVTGGNDTDTCVHLVWSGYRDGEYEAHWSNTKTLDITGITGVADGDTESVTIFSEGARSAGDAYDTLNIGSDGTIDSASVVITTQSVTGSSGDEITLEGCDTSVTDYLCASGDIGTLSGGVLTLTSDVSAVEVQYALATPVEYTLDNPISSTYPVADFGTEKVEPLLDDDGNPSTAPFRAKIYYSTDFTREVANLPENYDSCDSLDNLCSALATALSTALGGTLTITRGDYDESTKTYAFSVTYEASE